MDVKSMEAKAIDADANAFINHQVAESHQEIYFRGWVNLYYSSSGDKAAKERIFVITNFRIYVVKINVVGRKQVRQKFPILNLKSLSAVEDSPNKLSFEFEGEGVAIIEHPRVIDIAQSILFAFQSVSFGRPPSAMPKFSLPDEWTASFKPPEPDAQDGLLATYLAECDLQGVPQRVPVLDAWMTNFQLQDRTFDIGEAMQFLVDDKVSTVKNDITAIANSLRFSHWFTDVMVIDFPLRTDGVAALSSIFSHTTSLRKLVLVNVKGGKTGFEKLASTLAMGVHSLTYLNIAKNNIGDQGLKAVCDGLLDGKKVLHTLCLNSCGFSGAAYKHLTKLLQTPTWLAGLKILDVSDNKAGKAGTQALCAWLDDANVLIEQLFLKDCDLHLETLLASINSNAKLGQHTLKTVNISGSKLGKKSYPTLANILHNTHSLSKVHMANTSLPREGFINVLDLCLRNTKGVRFYLDFSTNNLGVKGAQDMNALLMDWLKKDNEKIAKGPLRSLVLADNNLGNEGILTVCKSLSGTSLESLALDNNITVGLLTKGKEAGDALAKLVINTPNLHELSLTGDESHYMKGMLNPLFAALGTNSSLTHLDVSRNRMGDAGIVALAGALLTNKTLTSFNADNNRATMKGLRELHEACEANKTLVDWVIPMEDIERIWRSGSEKKVAELQQIVRDFESYMDRNEAVKSGRVLGAPGSGSSQAALSPTDEHSPSDQNLGLKNNKARGGHRHRKTASRMFDIMTAQKRPEGEVSIPIKEDDEDDAPPPPQTEPVENKDENNDD